MSQSKLRHWNRRITVPSPDEPGDAREARKAVRKHREQPDDYGPAFFPVQREGVVP